MVIDGVPVKLFDTAGYHQSTDVIESIGISKINKILKEADLVVYVQDESGLDKDLFNQIKDLKHIVVHNKADLLNDNNDGETYISVKEHDIKPLLDLIKKELNISPIKLRPSFYNIRQLAILKRIASLLETAINDVDNDEPIDLISVSIMSAYNASLDLLGEGNKNDLTDEIFSRFCVGK